MTHCRHESMELNPAEPDVGIALPYASCNDCGETSSDVATDFEVERDEDGGVVVIQSVSVVWADEKCDCDCDCAECDPCQPDESDDPSAKCCTHCADLWRKPGEVRECPTPDAHEFECGICKIEGVR